MRKANAMRTWLLWVPFSLLALGCGNPGYTSAMRTNFDGDVPIATHCFRYGDKESWRFAAHVDKLSEQGWRLAYVSEYTSTSRSKFFYTVCVERALDVPPAPETPVVPE